MADLWLSSNLKRLKYKLGAQMELMNSQMILMDK